MSNNDNFQLYSKEKNINENIQKENIRNSHKKKTRNKNKDKIDDEIKVELVLKNNNKTESTIERTKNNDLILPKIESNNTLKQTHENDINYLSESKEILNNKNLNEKETKKLMITNENKINIDNQIKKEKDNNKNNSKENFEAEEKKLTEIFNKNKKNLMEICSEIEEHLSKLYTSKGKIEDNNKLNKTQNINSYNNSKSSKEQNELIKKINNYKMKINTAQNELDVLLRLNKVDELENILQERKRYLEKIKRENSVLKKMKSLQEKDEKEVKDIINKKEELFSVNEKINKMKDESKIKKDYNHTLSEKIKSQNELINNLQNKCHLINQNIEYYKKKQIQSIKTNNDSDNNNEIENLNLNDLKKLYEEKVNNIVEKQEMIKIKIKEQNIKIKEIKDFNEVISTKIEKIMLQIKNNLRKIITFENELKRKEYLIYDSINKRKNTLAERKPFHVGPINIKPKTKKIFDYQKYLKDFEKNKNRNKVFSSVDVNSKPKTLREIEKLRTDIQQAIKKNELDEKIDKIIDKLKNRKKNEIKNIITEEDDILNNLFKRNEEINGSNRYNFYVTEGANLPIALKQENINSNLNSSDK